MDRSAMTRWGWIAGRLFLGGVFLYAAYTKLSQPSVLFAMSINAYKLLPENAALVLARVLPWAELALGVALIAGIFQRASTLASTALLGVFFTVMVHAYQPGKQGEQISCGCFGIGEAISPRTLARDGALLALSIALTIGAFRSARRSRQAAPPASAEAVLAEKS